MHQAANDSSEFQRQLWRQETLRSLEIAKEEGVTIYEVDLAPFVAKVAPMLEDVEDPAVRSLVRAIRGTE